MCTLLFRHQPGDPHPLVILSNRDEAYARESSGWRWSGDSPQYFAPKDEVGGGTWIGISEWGVVVALTNIFPPLKGDDFRSRGALVTDMFSLRTASKARRRVRALIDENEFQKFNLLVADGRHATVFSFDGLGLWEGDLVPGSYQIGNEPWNGGKLPKSTGTNLAWMESHRGDLAQHPTICKHGEKYGTRSSSLILLDGMTPRNTKIWHAEGRPCETAYHQVEGIGE